MKLKNLVLVGLLYLFFISANGQNIKEMPTIDVTGTAEIQVMPDTATFSFTISKKNNLVAVAKKQNDETVAKVTDMAKRFGIAASDVKTDYIRVSEATRREKIKGTEEDYENVPDGFRVSRNLVVKLRDMTRFESFLTALLDAGVTDVDNVVFSSSEIRKYKDRARSQAIRAAKEKAQAIASEIGQTIGKAVSIEENNIDGYRSPLANSSSNSVSIDGDVSPEISAVGAISVKAQVTVSFLLN